MKQIGLLLFFAVFACSLSAQNRLSVFIGNANRYASICRISVGASAWNTIFRQNRSIIITGVAAEIGGMWALRWRSPEPRDEACAISVIITDVIRVRAGGGF